MARFRLALHLSLGASVLVAFWVAGISAPPDGPSTHESTPGPARVMNVAPSNAELPPISEAEQREFIERDEEKADGLLGPALEQFASGNERAGRKRLQAIVDKYPDTGAAERARRYLAE